MAAYRRTLLALGVALLVALSQASGRSLLQNQAGCKSAVDVIASDPGAWE